MGDHGPILNNWRELIEKIESSGDSMNPHELLKIKHDAMDTYICIREYCSKEYKVVYDQLCKLVDSKVKLDGN